MRSRLIRHSYTRRNGMTIFGLKMTERRGTAIRADPKPVSVLMKKATNITMNPRARASTIRNI
ncbi:MAG: hypothetical protein ACXQS7_03635 [Candidatus Syntropharchaeia archaeon]